MKYVAKITITINQLVHYQQKGTFGTNTAVQCSTYFWGRGVQKSKSVL